jgi:hypothetical protein
MRGGLATSMDLTWLKRFLTTIDPSNHLEQIRLGMFFCEDTFDPGDCLAWSQVDRILADGHFKFLRQLNFNIAVSNNDDDSDNDYIHWLGFDRCGPVAKSIVVSFPLLVELGVELEVSVY